MLGRALRSAPFGHYRPKVRRMSVSEPAAEGGFVLRNASNTGLVGASISEGSLSDQGAITYNTSYNGQTITGKRFTDTVRITGNNITIDGCLFEWGSATDQVKLGSSGTGNIVSNSTFRNSSGYTYHQINVTGGSLTVDLCDISDYQDGITADGGSLTCRRSYFHDTAAPDPGIHRDGIEIYGGSNHLIELCTIAHANFAPTGTDRETSAINIAPWSGSDNVSGVIIQDNYIDGGHMHVVIDSNQSGTHTVSNVRVLRNRFGGHTTVDVINIYTTVNALGTTRVETEAALDSNPTDRFWWPNNAGPDVNYWWYCTNNPFGYPDLSPDNEGEIAQA
jgi:hypothetical protein